MNNIRKKILLIDDNDDIIEAVQMLLSDAGYDVESLASQDLITHVETFVPDVIILDMLLSGKDGRDIIRILKSRPSTQHIPIILNSAHPEAKYIWKQSGADDFIAKPFDIDVLLTAIQKHL